MDFKKLIRNLITDNNPLQINLDDTVEHAKERMEEEGKSSALVVKDGVPVYYLRWPYLVGEKSNSAIGNLANSNKLDRVTLVEKGMTYDEAYEKLREKQGKVIVVVENECEKPLRINGTVSPYDKDYAKMM